jgi:2-polyprenyl-3-methyl-5-hydroxy-6-metoxy-1,4-benzoquinol methylase
LTSQLNTSQKIAPTICPILGTSEIKPLCVVSDFEIWRCPQSATDFVWPMPSDASIEQIYSRSEWFSGGERGGYVDYDAQSAPSHDKIAAILDKFPDGGAGLTLLDVGCGYGGHLKLAKDKGWKAYGVETSDHARSVADSRFGKELTIVKRVEDLLPQRYDVILMLDVIEHLREPYKLFFSLFGKGAIEKDTLVIISTPNARSFDAIRAPADWAYRHPPSHLIFYSAKSLDILLRRLMFTDIQINGVVPVQNTSLIRYDDESVSLNDALAASQGLFVEVRGSNFKEFMHERYVPGGFWKLTDYEHVPRYSYASQFAINAKVLDFGCGTGYGSSHLANVAGSVVGLDISTEAIEWACIAHQKPELKFLRSTDLGADLSSASFDLITCFEMIEHVDHETQINAINNMARLLTSDGKLIISTPDPSYTAPYGENPYHIREMSEQEFYDLLSPHFKHVKMLKQWVRPSIVIGETSIPNEVKPAVFGALDEAGGFDSLVGFVAICSQTPIDSPSYFCQFDTSIDFNLATLNNELKVNQLRLNVIEAGAEKEYLEKQIHNLDQILIETREWVTHLTNEKDEYADSLLKSTIVPLRNQIQGLIEEKVWLEAQRLAWEKSAADQELITAKLQAQVQNLLQGNEWLEAQRLAWEQSATAQELTITDLQTQAQDLYKSNNWLGSKNQALLSELKTVNDELSKSNQILSKVRSHKGMRLVNFLAKRTIF